MLGQTVPYGAPHRHTSRTTTNVPDKHIEELAEIAISEECKTLTEFITVQHNQ